MGNPVYRFDFTSYETHLSHKEIIAIIRDHTTKWAFQLEKGETGKLHYQGRFSLKNKVRSPTQVAKLLGVTWHFSITSNDCKDNDDYVTKTDTREAGPWRHDDPPPPYIPRQIREIEKLRPWQQHIVDDAHIWDTRHINIIIDETGNHGKSILKTWVGVHGIGRSLPFMNDYRDLMRVVMDTPKKPLYIIDIPRSLKKDHLFQFFAGIETLKDGYAYDDRYKFREEYFDCPNIWVFMNTVPETSMLSKDRWKIWEFSLEEDPGIFLSGARA